MRRQGRAMKGELEHGVDSALAQGTVTALAGLAFVAVAREGLETVLFLFALGAQTADLITSTLIGAALGLAVGDRHRLRRSSRPGIRIDLRRFFTFTGVVLIFVSAGLVAFAIHAFGEAGLIVNQGAVFDLSGVLPENEPARVGAGRALRLPRGPDAARAHRLPRLPDPGADPVRVRADGRPTPVASGPRAHRVRRRLTRGER